MTVFHKMQLDAAVAGEDADRGVWWDSDHAQFRSDVQISSYLNSGIHNNRMSATLPKQLFAICALLAADDTKELKTGRMDAAGYLRCAQTAFQYALSMASEEGHFYQPDSSFDRFKRAVVLPMMRAGKSQINLVSLLSSTSIKEASGEVVWKPRHVDSVYKLGRLIVSEVRGMNFELVKRLGGATAPTGDRTWPEVLEEVRRERWDALKAKKKSAAGAAAAAAGAGVDESSPTPKRARRDSDAGFDSFYPSGWFAFLYLGIPGQAMYRTLVVPQLLLQHQKDFIASAAAAAHSTAAIGAPAAAVVASEGAGGEGEEDAYHHHYYSLPIAPPPEQAPPPMLLPPPPILLPPPPPPPVAAVPTEAGRVEELRLKLEERKLELEVRRLELEERRLEMEEKRGERQREQDREMALAQRRGETLARAAEYAQNGEDNSFTRAVIERACKYLSEE